MRQLGFLTLHPGKHSQSSNTQQEGSPLLRRATPGPELSDTPSFLIPGARFPSHDLWPTEERREPCAQEGSPHPPHTTVFPPPVTLISRCLFSSSGGSGLMLFNCIWPLLCSLLSNAEIGPFLLLKAMSLPKASSLSLSPTPAWGRNSARPSSLLFPCPPLSTQPTKSHLLSKP